MRILAIETSNEKYTKLVAFLLNNNYTFSDSEVQ